ncbi:MAG TPA: DUF929 family protein [Acidimicrobiales bacterium]|nr:DUF929 family protein [Acidimicrobiales bacterium]
MAKNPPNRRGPARGPAAPNRRPAPPGRGRPAGLFTWIAIGLVVVVVATLVIVKVTTGSSSPSSQAFSPVDATTLHELTSVPASVFNTIGVTSTVAAVTPPVVLANQKLLTAKSSTGATLPEILYVGANYCPFCAAERWASIIALSRFGTWSNLGNMESSTHSGEIYPGTPTFTFEKAKLSSPYLTFAEVEEYTNQFSSSLGFYTTLQKPTTAEQRIFAKYDTSHYIPGFTSQQDGSIPFYSFGNQVLIAGASYTPALLANQSRTQIAAGLSTTSSPITAAIITTANYITAATCVMTKNKPGSVCDSKGVMAAKKVMKVK